MSFSSLPTELVRQIIESSVPSTFHSTTYRQRQSVLRSVSLVSRRFRQVAQTLLFEVIWAQSPENLADALDAVGSQDSYYRILQAVVEYPEDPQASLLQRLLVEATNLRILALDCIGEQRQDISAVQFAPRSFVTVPILLFSLADLPSNRRSRCPADHGQSRILCESFRNPYARDTRFR